MCPQTIVFSFSLFCIEYDDIRIFPINILVQQLYLFLQLLTDLFITILFLLCSCSSTALCRSSPRSMGSSTNTFCSANNNVFNSKRESPVFKNQPGKKIHFSLEAFHTSFLSEIDVLRQLTCLSNIVSFSGIEKYFVEVCP